MMAVLLKATARPKLSLAPERRSRCSKCTCLEDQPMCVSNMTSPRTANAFW
jgi:hypothetical protein